MHAVKSVFIIVPSAMDGYARICFIAVNVIYLGGSLTKAGEVDCSNYMEFIDKAKDCCKHKYNDEEFDIEEVKERATKCAKKYADGSPGFLANWEVKVLMSQKCYGFCSRQPQTSDIREEDHEVPSSRSQEGEQEMKTSKNNDASDRMVALDVMECVTECTLNGTKLLTKDMKINVDFLLHYFYYDDKDEYEEWRKLWKTSVETCLGKTVKNVNANAKCKSGVLYFLPCLSEKTIINCPAELLDTTRKECVRMKTYFEKCSMFRTL